MSQLVSEDIRDRCPLRPWMSPAGPAMADIADTYSARSYSVMTSP